MKLEIELSREMDGAVESILDSLDQLTTYMWEIARLTSYDIRHRYPELNDDNWVNLTDRWGMEVGPGEKEAEPRKKK